MSYAVSVLRPHPLSSGGETAREGAPPLSTHDSPRLHFGVLQPFPLIHWPLGKAFLLWGLPFST